MASSSQQQQRLFEIIENSPDINATLATITFIPGLVPGNDENQIWLGKVRSLLWNEEDYRQHEEICSRKRKPQSLTIERQSQTLVPISTNTFVWGLAELDAQDEDDSFDRIDNLFVISRQAVQDKVLSPIIEELDVLIKSGNKESTDHCFDTPLFSLRALVVEEKDAVYRLKE
ncbi:hypothetical protein COCC4DRAFT_135068 [Bipolaris maydis ATCC 48331]|uniref:Uncharacterized protein n=2 Tax=Cochliobolus heterostrophus TaxID=5016 RepID=M2TX00_COCH5|nr:uncharacterized protein COCC4DRAFT_135068 [Bipolaris maydis ATCC 48331]EMD86256.1 hypothetical protein COCHEDRAFT_1160561 [Bipolaris maydis C5]ENI06202.1 hypothetical protein COCC4DRAFT_135068 [Bipolaris maydis ATCC 48331]KAJ6213883.1 hypothetical protein PSV09DRAFT_1160561 [Bipolaris maydis]